MATRCYFNHWAVQRRTRKPEAAGDDKLVIRLILERVSGSLVRSAGEFIVETSTPLAEKEIWVDFCRIKQFSSDASIESEYAEMMAESLSSIGVPEAEHAAIIESVFVAVDAAVSSKLPLDVGLWDVTYRLQLNDGFLSSQSAAAVSWYLRRVVIGKPGTPIFEAIVYVLKKGEGGRHSPLFAGYRPQFYLM
ncbi:hypothetical protein M0R45_020086 [Rubus argutus]|uniref:Translation elongation factor EFTu/EF1A C-terminal domain-containing protein n=1 Tax=Rubus argutus TaxID=59490 RepID=A0AAW1X9P6_RUBAR